MDDENTQNVPAPEPSTPGPEPAPEESVAAIIPEPVTPSEQSAAESTSVDPVAQAEPVTEPVPITEPTSDQESTPVSAPAAQTPTEPWTQSPAQSPQAPISAPSTPVVPQTPPTFTQSTQFRDIQAHGRIKIQEHRQNKLEKIIEYAQKKQTITNDEVQKLVRVSDATATRYLVDLVKQGRLVREGSPRHAIYRFVR